MSMDNDIEWGARGNPERCEHNSQLRIVIANSLAVIGLSWGLHQKRNGTEPTLTNLTDPRTKLQRT